MEKEIEELYAIWQRSLQLIGTHSDIRRFQRIFDTTKGCIVNDINKKEQKLKELLAKNKKELIDAYKRLRELECPNFESRLDFIRKRESDIFKVKNNLKTVYDKFRQKAEETSDRLQNLLRNLPEQHQQRLSSKKVRSFKVFTTDESHVGQQCNICLEEIDVGRIMRRLTCDGQHYFCQQCIDGWFAEHNTCPLCRHKFD